MILAFVYVTEFKHLIGNANESISISPNNYKIIALRIPGLMLPKLNVAENYLELSIQGRLK